MVQFGNNKVISSYGVGTVRIIGYVDGVEHKIARQDVIYISGIMHNLIYIEQVRKNVFQALFDDDLNNARRGKLDLQQ